MASGRNGNSQRRTQGQGSPAPQKRSGGNRSENRNKSTGSRSRSRQQRLRARKRKRMLRRMICFLLMAGVLFGIIQLLLFLRVRKYDNGKIMDGVYIGETNVGGMTVKEADQELQDLIESYQDGILELKTDENKSTKVTYEELGLTADAEKLAKMAMDYGKEGSLFARYLQIRKCEKEGYVIPMNYSVDKKTAAAVLEEQCEPLFDGPVDATLAHKSGEMVITEGKEGQVLDTAATLKAIRTFLNEDWNGEDGIVSVQYQVTKPDIQAKDLEEVQDLLGSYETSFYPTGSSAQNIEAGAKHINGSIVMPGTEFSANEAMEPYTEEEGYTESGSYANGEVVQTMGGGICQVSTTLYNALLLAELEITERMPHSMMIDYVDPSMDAAIADDIKDLKFKNNYDTAVYLECIVGTGTLKVNIYGKETRPSNRTVEFESEILATDEEEGVRYVATDNYVGYYEVISAARKGVSAQLWKIVYEDGKEVSRDVINTSYYTSAKKTIGVGTATSDEALKNKVLAAISTQDEETILNAIYGGGDSDSEE